MNIAASTTTLCLLWHHEKGLQTVASVCVYTYRYIYIHHEPIFFSSPDVILCSWLGLKHWLTNYLFLLSAGKQQTWLLPLQLKFDAKRTSIQSLQNMEIFAHFLRFRTTRIFAWGPINLISMLTNLYQLLCVCVCVCVYVCLMFVCFDFFCVETNFVDFEEFGTLMVFVQK